jgi:zinc finger HIT domain-containing protein 3
MKCIVCNEERANYRCRTCRSAYCSSACYKQHRMSREEAAAAAAAAKAKTGSSAAQAADEGVPPPTLDFLCEVITAAQQQDGDRESKRQRAEAEADVFSDLSREKAAAVAAASSQRGRPDETSLPASTPATQTVPSESGIAGAAPPLDAAVEPHAQRGANASRAKEPAANPRGSPQPQQSGSTTSTVTEATSGEVGKRGEEVAADADAVYILQEKHLSALANDPTVRSALRSPSLQKLIRTIDSSRSRLDALDAAQYNNADFKRFCNEVMRVIARAEGR